MAEAQISRTRTTLLDQLCIIEPNNLRNPLKAPDEDRAPNAATQRNGIVTLASILGSDASSSSGRTLMEIIREEDEARVSERVSLMALLALADGAGEGTVASAVFEVEEEEEEERMVCCVCMVRRKGAAFIPCGHTFCRLCSRELLAGRGSCALCNAVIVDVLDIF